MARKEVDVCDFACDRIASGKCALCEQDGCPNHIGNRIVVSATLRPVPRMGALSLDLRSHQHVNLHVCEDCFEFFTHKPDTKRFGERDKDEKAFQERWENTAMVGAQHAQPAVLEQLKAEWAKQALTKDGDSR